MSAPAKRGLEGQPVGLEVPAVAGTTRAAAPARRPAAASVAGPPRETSRRRIPSSVAVALAVLVALAVAGSWPGIDPYSMDLGERLAGPSKAHWLGTDRFGRDLLARSLAAARHSLLIACGAAAAAGLAGTALGLSAARGGLLEEGLARAVDALVALPSVLLAMLLAVVLGPGDLTVGAAITLALVPGYFRVSRGLAVALREAPYVEAAQALGATWAHIARHHLLAGMARPLLAQGAASAAIALLADAGLSYLGLGPQPPMPSWGLLLKEAQ
ncbi:MAG: ABC transporter permease subunit, partial [Bacillota bacterium]